MDRERGTVPFNHGRGVIDADFRGERYSRIVSTPLMLPSAVLVLVARMPERIQSRPNRCPVVNGAKFRPPVR